MMETEEEASHVFEEESQEEEEDIIITQEEEEGESEEVEEESEEEVEEVDEEFEEESEEEYEEEEEAEQLEEMKPPVVTSWMGPDGITVHGIVCIDDGIIRLKNQCQLDDCTICYNPSATHGKHQICCLPCGHIYGFSCIKKWLLLSSSAGKCPQCNNLCSFQDAILIYPTRLCVTAHQGASSAAFFPFTKQGSLEFQKYEYSRMCDARLLRLADLKHMNILVPKYNDSASRVKRLATHWVNLLTVAEELEERAESLGLTDALRRQASPLGPWVEALRRRAYALKRLCSALRQRIDAQRSDAYESRMKFYSQMYDEHHKREEEISKAEHALESKEKLTEKAAAKAKNEGEKEVAEKKHKDKEKKGACESEKQKQQREGPDSISKVILKHKKSNNYMYYYAAGAAAVLIVPLAVGYTLYA